MPERHSYEEDVRIRNIAATSLPVKPVAITEPKRMELEEKNIYAEIADNPEVARYENSNCWAVQDNVSYKEL